MQSLLNVGKREEALLLFFRDLVKTPPQEIAALQAGPAGRDGSPQRTPFIGNCKVSAITS